MPISESVIKNIHALVLMNHPEDKGFYRRIPVRITGAFIDCKRYYEAFDAYYKEKDAMPVAELIAEYINERVDEYLAILEK